MNTGVAFKKDMTEDDARRKKLLRVMIPVTYVLNLLIQGVLSTIFPTIQVTISNETAIAL